MLSIGTAFSDSRHLDVTPSKKEKGRQLLSRSRIKAVYAVADDVVCRAELLLLNEGYALRLHTRKDVFWIAGHDESRPRTWRSADRAIAYVRSHFEGITTIYLYLTETE